MKFMKVTGNPILSYICVRVMRRNQNFLCCFTGQTGSGKTYGSLTLAEEVSKVTGNSFGPDNIVFSLQELMTLINSGKLAKGSVIVYEEAGVSYNNREWQSLANKLLNYLMQTFRHRNYVVIFTMPDFTFVDVAARKLFHARFETVNIDYAHNLLYCKPLFLEIVQSMGKQFNKYFRIPAKGILGFFQIRRMAFRLASPKLLRQYEKKKQEYTDRLNAEIQAKLHEDAKTSKYDLTLKQEVYVLLSRGNMTVKEIAVLLKKSSDQIRNIKRNLETEGVLNAAV
jgi:DNA-binding CsgD family transcriptional regulator